MCIKTATAMNTVQYIGFFLSAIATFTGPSGTVISAREFTDKTLHRLKTGQRKTVADFDVLRRSDYRTKQ